jgi:CheY-like chemotaxis protein
VRVEVADTGAGIAPKDHEGIWDEFRQLPTNAGPGGMPQGTGLGLALSRQLVRRMGGVIWVESAEGAGSTFGFVMPRRPPAEKPARTEAEETAESTRPLALVVEDYPPTLKLLVDWLTEAGMATASATDGEAALAQARRLRPRMIVLDLQLPRRDGWEVLTELKNDPATADIPVVVVTAGEDRTQPIELDVQEFFVKPLHREDFFRRLRAVQPELFGGGRPIKVLVVDDDPASRRWIGGLLSGEGVHVTEAANGREALEVLRSNLPDLVVLDLLMPEMDGFAVVEAIRGEPAWDRLPIIVTTAKDLTEEERRRLTGRTQALVAKHRLTPDKLREQLRGLGLLPKALAEGE